MQSRFILVFLRLYAIFITLFFNPVHSTSICERLIQQYESRHGIPKNLLKAIAHIESGRHLPGIGIIPWPWTINAQGKSYVLETKALAIAKVQELQKQGITSIDVGCMQINLKHHPKAFATLEDAFDPLQNIAYAVDFLLQKKRTQGNWQEAVGHYHSATFPLSQSYKARVLQSWSNMSNISSANALYTLHEVQENPMLEANTHFHSFTGRRIPVRVRFSPLTSQQAKHKPTLMRYGKNQPASIPNSTDKSKVSSSSPKIYKITAKSKGRFYKLNAQQ